MEKYPYQAAIVGRDTMPLGHREKWAFLEMMMKDMHSGQAIRLTLTVANEKRLRPDIRWGRLCKKKDVIPHSRIARNGSDNVTMYLWFEK